MHKLQHCIWLLLIVLFVSCAKPPALPNYSNGKHSVYEAKTLSNNPNQIQLPWQEPSNEQPIELATEIGISDDALEPISKQSSSTDACQIRYDLAANRTFGAGNNRRGVESGIKQANRNFYEAFNECETAEMKIAAVTGLFVTSFLLNDSYRAESALKYIRKTFPNSPLLQKYRVYSDIVVECGSRLEMKKAVRVEVLFLEKNIKYAKLYGNRAMNSECNAVSRYGDFINSYFENGEKHIPLFDLIHT